MPGLLRICTAGRTTMGRARLIGRLLYDSQAAYEIRSDRCAVASRTTAGPIDFSLFTDGLARRAEQGITIDVAYRYFATAKRKFILADTPGHEQYTRNMATGASTAEVAIMLVDASHGIRANERHAQIAGCWNITDVRARGEQDRPGRLRQARIPGIVDIGAGRARWRHACQRCRSAHCTATDVINEASEQTHGTRDRRRVTVPRNRGSRRAAPAAAGFPLPRAARAQGREASGQRGTGRVGVHWRRRHETRVWPSGASTKVARVGLPDGDLHQHRRRSGDARAGRRSGRQPRRRARRAASHRMRARFNGACIWMDEQRMQPGRPLALFKPGRTQRHRRRPGVACAQPNRTRDPSPRARPLALGER